MSMTMDEMSDIRCAKPALAVHVRELCRGTVWLSLLGYKRLFKSTCCVVRVRDGQAGRGLEAGAEPRAPRNAPHERPMPAPPYPVPPRARPS